MAEQQLSPTGRKLKRTKLVTAAKKQKEPKVAKVTKVAVDSVAVDWNDRQRKILLDALIFEVRTVNSGSDIGFKKQQWTRIVNIFRVESGRNYSKQQLQTQNSVMKGDWLVFKELRNNTRSSSVKAPNAESRY